MRFSKYVLEIPLDDDEVSLVGLHLRTAITLPRTTLMVVREALEAGVPFESSVASLANFMVRNEMLVPDDDDELDRIARRTIAARAVSGTFTAIVVPTMRCNLRCHYCFQSHDDHGRESAPLSSESTLLAFLAQELEQRNLNRLHVRWFGGEPLLALDQIARFSHEVVDYCERAKKEYTADIVTNGVLLTADSALRLLSYQVRHVQVTFDGDRTLHNRIRRGDGVADSYGAILENIASAPPELKIRARVHVAPYNLDAIPRLLDDLVASGLHRKLQAIYFAPLFNYDQTSKGTAFERQDRLFLTSRDFAHFQVPLHKRALEMGFSMADPLEADYGVCTALRENTVVINADGTLAKCYMDAGDSVESYGNISEGILNSENLVKWRRQSFLKDSECRECTMAPVCLGGCSKEVQDGADKAVICTPLKYNYRELLRLHLDDGLGPCAT